MNATFYVVDRDGMEHQNLNGDWVTRRELAILATAVKPGDLVRDVLTVTVDEHALLVRSEADDHRQRVAVGFRVTWGDQYEPGEENLVTEDFFRRIVTEQDSTDSAGVWLGRHFGWSAEPNTDGAIRDSVFDSRSFGNSGRPTAAR